MRGPVFVEPPINVGRSERARACLRPRTGEDTGRYVLLDYCARYDRGVGPRTVGEWGRAGQPLRSDRPA